MYYSSEMCIRDSNENALPSEWGELKYYGA